MLLSSLIVRSISRMTTGTSSSSSKCISSSVKLGSARMSTKSSVAVNDSRTMLPWLMLPRTIDCIGDVKKDYRLYSPAENKVIMTSVDENVALVGCSDSWLVLHNRRMHNLFCYDPVSDRRIQLPSMVTVPEKVIFSSDMDMAIMCVKDRLAFCVPGRTALWTDLILKLIGEPYKDFVYSSKHKLLFCETKFGGKIESWDVSNPRSPKIVWRTSCLEEGGYYNNNRDDESNSTVRYMVFADKSDELFLVKRYMQEEGTKTTGFDVFVVDVSGKLRYVDGSFNGLSLFVGANNCFAFPAEPELFVPDSIYFTDKNHHPDIGIYNYQSRIISYYPSIKNSTRDTCPLPAVWLTPTLSTPVPPMSNSSKTCPAAVSNSSSKNGVTPPWKFLQPLTRNNEEDYKLYSVAENRVKMVKKKKRGKKEEEVIEWSAAFEDMGLRPNSENIRSAQGLSTYNSKYLVFDDHSNQLFLIIQQDRHIGPVWECVHKVAGFDIYKIDDWEGGGGRLIYMDGSLNGLSLFIGDNKSFALTAADFPGLKPDSIYYSTRRDGFGIFNYQDGTFAPSSDFQFGPFE